MMGGKSSKGKKGGDDYGSPTTPVQIKINSAYIEHLSSYERACSEDPKLESFDSALHERTNRVINKLASGVEIKSLSFDSLREVTQCLLDMNQDVVKVILQDKEDIWNNQDLFSLYEKVVRGQKEMITSIRIGTYISVKEMDNISVLVRKVEVEIESLLKNAEFAVTEEEKVVRLAIDEIKKKLDVFTETIEELGKHANKYCSDVTKARTVILQRIIRYPTGRKCCLEKAVFGFEIGFEDCVGLFPLAQVL
ncbi:unnamed protein product [Thlaspi arvense]|uniref:Uncharacterized protein n=1 Tax=Thlaspi arvense TaxID=13288 RepID=A0AAU9RVH1_THLAR|nr:unnamed protein product [Thlaspi arvense]